jgi:hypothetical protein
VWHSTPIKNPGRGLSTVANLTYNSQKRVDLLNPLPYGQTGTGFSLGVSGLTRLNEPLQVLASGAVAFTDPDGTRHDFTLETDGISYKAPPGVNLHLRRYNPDLRP